MTNDPGGEDPATNSQLDSDNSEETPVQQPDPPSQPPAAEPPIEEDYDVSGNPVVALRPPKKPHKERFQNTALFVIFWLIVFFTVATLGTALYAEAHFPGDTLTTFASDLAKTAIPTLIALLGTAAAWAFKEDKD